MVPSGKALRDSLARGEDLLGAAFLAERSLADRRRDGATYTPAALVHAMLERAASMLGPGEGLQRVVDPGAGSGRFSVAAGRRFPRAQLVAIECDPRAAAIASTNLEAAGLADRSEVVTADYVTHRLPPIDGRTLFIGNPPYVRHHALSPTMKSWLAQTAAARGLSASGLAGLHVYFFLATLEQAEPGDLGVLVTAAEWLDVGYGKLVRELLLGPLGGRSLHLLDHCAEPFPGVATTAVVTCFRVGEAPTSMRFRTIRRASELAAPGRPVRRERLALTDHWSTLARPRRAVPANWIQLGELCRVHRGQVTGANGVWVRSPSWQELPQALLVPSVTRARELFQAGVSLRSTDQLRRVVELPVELDELEPEVRAAVERFLVVARTAGTADGYIARHRRAWWAVGLRAPAPILATYMARRPPAFVRNLAEARHINIAHGLYPRQSLTAAQLDRLAASLTAAADVTAGRTYAGGLTKFEPSEMARILIPSPV